MPTVQHAIDVSATPDDCWRIFSDLSHVDALVPHAARGATASCAPGGKLTLYFAAGPARLPVDVRIEDYRPGELMRWIGGKLGVRGDHSYILSRE